MDELLKVLEHYQIPFDEKIICPFHGDINPSLKINNEENFWWCFGCQQGGNAYDFHKKMQNQNGITNELDILQSYTKIIRGKANKENVEKSKQINYEKKNKKYFRQCLIEAKDYYYGLKSVDWFKEDNEAVAYMTYRGFLKSTLNRFGAKNTYNDETYPIVFPILDNGRFKGWVCRTFDSEIQKRRKYLYNKGFRRKTTLAGTYNKSNTVMLVEGYFDMLKAKQLGIKNVCAVLGWKITDNQIMKLKAEGVDKIISALDNDTCGKKGTNYLKKYFDVIPFPYPDNIKDMGDMDRKTLKSIEANFSILSEVK